jgi:hypothetical protein
MSDKLPAKLPAYSGENEHPFRLIVNGHSG